MMGRIISIISWLGYAGAAIVVIGIAVEVMKAFMEARQQKKEEQRQGERTRSIQKWSARHPHLFHLLQAIVTTVVIVGSIVLAAAIANIYFQ